MKNFTPILGIKDLKTIIKHKWKQLIELGEDYAGGVIFMEGASGIGKTAIQKQIANEFYNEYLKENDLSEPSVITTNLAAKESTDFSGLPYIKNGKTFFAKPNDIPDEGCGILFFDEANRIHDLELKSVMLNFLNDREINGHKLGKNYIMIAAGNFFDDEQYDTIEFDKAMNERLIHFELSPTIEEVIAYLEGRYQDHFLIDCLKLNTNLVCTTSESGLSPRQYEHAIKDTYSLKDNISKNKDLIYLLLEGILGRGPLEIIKQFLDKKQKIQIKDILQNTDILKRLDRTDSATIQVLTDQLITYFVKMEESANLDTSDQRGIVLSEEQRTNLQMFFEKRISTDNLYSFYIKLQKLTPEQLIFIQKIVMPFSQNTKNDLLEIVQSETAP